MVNLHPLFVHFPIALLTLYSVTEFIPAKWLGGDKIARAIRFLLVATGSFGAWLALATGEEAEEIFNNPLLTDVVGVHSFLAGVVALIFGLLFFAYAFSLIYSYPKFKHIKLKQPLVWLNRIASFILMPQIKLLLVVLGFVGIFIVGSLGASLVYGPDIDPFVSFVYRLFF